MYVCPNCASPNRSQEIREGERCPSCGAKFDPGKWPVQEAYCPKGVIPRISFFRSGKQWEASSDDFIIGWEPGFSGLKLPRRLVAKQHARVTLENGEWTIRPMESNVVRLNSKEVNCGCLHTGDLVEIGPHLLMVSVTCVQEYVDFCASGKLKTDEEMELIPDKDRYDIGSDSARCQIVIDGADPVHAILYYVRGDKLWWLVDNASSSGVNVNNDRILNTKLFPNDLISIAGVDFLFKGDKLVCGKRKGNSVELSFENATATLADKKTILQDLNFRIKEGEFVGVLGPSGCGKSSVIQRIVGLAKFSGGKFLINGRQYDEFPQAYHALMAYLPQQNILHDDLTLRQEFLCFQSLYSRADAPVTDYSIEMALRLVGLEKEVGKKISQLSGGQQRRAGIALSLLREPQLLVLDEPTSGLDPATEKDVMTYLRRISNQRKTVVCSTHIMSNLALFDKIILLACDGRLVFFGTPDELQKYFKTEDPCSLYRLFASGSHDEQEDIAKHYAESYRKSQLFKKYNGSVPDEYELPPAHETGFMHQVWGYWKRMLFELFAFGNNESTLKTIRAFLTSSCFIQLFLQPVFIALALKLSCAYKMAIEFEHKEVLFFAAVIVFWLGLNNSVRSLVKERIPWRCLERLQRIPAHVYLFSKVTFSTALSFLQVVVFSAAFFELSVLNETFSLLPKFELQTQTFANYPDVIPFVGGIFIVLFLVCTMGSWIGLAISAFFKKESAAVSLLPIILVPILFFSQPFIRNDNYDDLSKEDNGQYAKLAVRIEQKMPCHAPEVLMADLLQQHNDKVAKKGGMSVEKTDTSRVWKKAAMTISLYLIAALGIMVYFQIRNESKWDGR